MRDVSVTPSACAQAELREQHQIAFPEISDMVEAAPRLAMEEGNHGEDEDAR